MKYYCGLYQNFLLSTNRLPVFISSYASQFECKSDQWSLIEYGFDDLYGVVSQQGNPLLIYQNMDRETQEIREDVEAENSIWAEDIDKNKINLSPEKLALYYYYAPYYKVINDKINYGSFIRLFPSDGSRTLLSYDFYSDTFFCKHGKDAYFEQKIDEDCYVYTPFKIRYVKAERYDTQLNLIWSHEEKARTPYVMDSDKFIDNGQSVIRNFKYEHVETTRIDGSGQKVGAVEYINGEIYCFAKSDGEILWKRQFEKMVDNLIAFDDQRLLAYTNSEFHLLDRENGTSLEVASTPVIYDKFFRAESHLLIHQGYLFLCHDKAKQLLIYDIKSMQCIRQENIETLGTRVSRLYALGNKVYITLNLPRKMASVWSGLLEIDCDDIQAPLNIEDDNVFELIDSTAEDGCITLIAYGLRIDDIVRLGEYQILEQMQIYGKGFFNETTVNKDFNGTVKLIIRNCLSEPEQVHEIVSMMEKRFEYFIKDADYKDGKGKGLCQLILDVET